MNPKALDDAARGSSNPLPRILIIDDHAFFSACLRTLVEGEGLAECDAVANEVNVVERVRTSRPDLLVIDLSVGSRGGAHLARRLREAKVTAPVLFLSSAPPPRRRLARVARASFVAKAGDPRLLLARIRRLLPARRATAGWTAARAKAA